MFFKLIEKLNYTKKFPYFICTPLIYAIGTASENIAIASNYANRNKKKLLIIKTHYFKKLLNYEVCNNALFDFLIFNNQKINKKNYLIKLISLLIQIEFAAKRFLAIKFKSMLNIDLGEEFRFAFLGTKILYSEKKNLTYKNLLPIRDNGYKVDIEKIEKDKCQEIIKKLNIEKREIVCLHVRDNGYHNDANRREYRNSNINNYINVIKYLIKKNYLVIRIGDKSAKKINFSNKYFIDYPFTNLKSEIMDLYLIQICLFYIGTPSGPVDTAYLFKKPVLLTNVYDLFSSFPIKRCDRVIPRKIINKNNGKVLSLNEFASLNIKYHQYHHTETDYEKFYFEENSSNELLYATKEFILNMEESENFKKKINFKEKQIIFNKYLNKRLEEIYNVDVIKNNYFRNNIWKKNEFIRIIKRFKSCEGTFSLSSLNNFYL